MALVVEMLQYSLAKTSSMMVNFHHADIQMKLWL